MLWIEGRKGSKREREKLKRNKKKKKEYLFIRGDFKATSKQCARHKPKRKREAHLILLFLSID